MSEGRRKPIPSGRKGIVTLLHPVNGWLLKLRIPLPQVSFALEGSVRALRFLNWRRGPLWFAVRTRRHASCPTTSSVPACHKDNADWCHEDQPSLTADRRLQPCTTACLRRKTTPQSATDFASIPLARPLIFKSSTAMKPFAFTISRDNLC